jgi:tRNA G18 (ribose-2'-O)-methylase SpoU
MKRKPYSAFDRHSIDSFKSAQKSSVCLVLDNIRSGLNIGSIFRTADAFGIEKIALCGISATPDSREVLKSALGATESMSWQYFESTSACLLQLKSEGWNIVGIEQLDESIALDQYQFQSDKKYALVFGNEVRGLSDDALPLLDAAIEIPQFGTKHSFNVAVSAAIVLWEHHRQH